MDIKFTNQSILITGGAGFIGSTIARYLVSSGAKLVRVVDNLSTGSKSNIEDLLLEDNFEFMWGDITSIETCKTACLDIDIICHQAALGSIPRSIADPINTHNSNVTGFVNMLWAAYCNGIRRFVYASSSSIYGTNPNNTKTETEIGNQISPYGATKYIDEIYAGVFTKIYSMECIGLRYFNVFGPRQNPDGAYAAVIPKFIKLVFNDQQPIVNGDGSYSRDFTYVDNAVYANILALSTTNMKCYGEAYNVGTGSSQTLNQLLNTISNVSEKNIIPIYKENRFGDVPHTIADIIKIREHLQYEPQVMFYDGIVKTIDYFWR